jgi:hypothetical protein
MSTILYPIDIFDIKLKNTTITKNNIPDCSGKNICMYFCDISSDVLDTIINSAQKVYYLNTSTPETNELVDKYNSRENFVFLLTRLTYQEYGEMTHPLKMAMEQTQKIQEID